MSAILTDRPILSLFKPGQHGSTFGGNPLAAAVARASLRVLIDENLIQNSADMGEYLLDGGMLVASVGEGTYVYTGLSFFRALPAGVPGAFRLFFNRLDLGTTMERGAE